MTKEKLAKEAEEKAKKRTKGFKCQDNCEKSYVMGALDFAEPREKQIQALGERCLQLQKDKGNLTDRVIELEAENEQIKNSDTLCKVIGEQKRKIAELEAQIEKMKNCYNCQGELCKKCCRKNKKFKKDYWSLSQYLEN